MNSENFLLSHIQKILNDDSIYVTPNVYSVFDYYNTSKIKKINCELKCRNVSSYTYKTTMISNHKIRHCSNPDTDYYFFFQFKDNIVKYIKYDKNLFNTFEKDFGGRCDRGKIEKSVYYYIPIDKCDTYIIN